MKKLLIEIADTPYRKERGLMFREKLADDAGMLFKFDNPQVLKFWGMNTYLPLDIAFISKDNKIIKIDRIKPFCLTAVSSETNCVMAIEANEDFFVKNGISIGSSIKIKNDDGFDCVEFEHEEG